MNGSDSAFPGIEEINAKPSGRDYRVLRDPGLTKRELFSGFALQGLIIAAATGKVQMWSHKEIGGRSVAGQFEIPNPKSLAEMAVEQADALLVALSLEPKTERRTP